MIQDVAKGLSKNLKTLREKFTKTQLIKSLIYVKPCAKLNFESFSLLYTLQQLNSRQLKKISVTNRGSFCVVTYTAAI